MQSSPRHGRAAFSLIELMTVIAIIVILASLIVGGLSYASERQAKEKCRIQMALLSKGLEAYKLDNGVYPPTSNIDGKAGSLVMYQALYLDGFNTPTTKRIYVPELDPVTTKQGWTTGAVLTVTSITDPWTNPYYYRSALKSDGSTNALTQNPDFDLWSIGKDALTNPGTPADPKNRDDIKNF